MATAINAAGCTYIAGEVAEVPRALELPVPPALDRTPPPVTLVRGGPSGELLAGPVPAPVPAGSVDRVIGGALRPRLTASERWALATASQRAATARTGEMIAWRADEDQAPASGGVLAVADVFRSLHGALCRNVRQSLDQGDEPRQQQVTLCRENLGSDVFVWILAQAEP